MTPARTSAGPGGTRCFLALLPDTAGHAALRRCRETLDHSLAGAARGVRWLEATSLHLTLRFLGDASGAQIEYLAHMLPTLARALPAPAARRYAIWPNRAHPRLLVLELDPPDALLALARECEALARKAGFAPEPRGFRAHLTLARLRPARALAALPAPPRAIAFDAIALMRSTLAQPAATYRELARAPIARAERPAGMDTNG